MPNWCTNVITIKAPEATKAQIKSLIINDKNEVDFTIIKPLPEPIKGILNFNDTNTGVILNKSHGDRLGLLNTADFIHAIKNKKHAGPRPNPVLSAFSLPSVSIASENDLAVGEPVELSQEDLALIDELEQALLTAQNYSPDTPVELVLEAVVNNALSTLEKPLNKSFPCELYEYRANTLGQHVIYGIKELEEELEIYCEKEFGVSNAYYWQTREWGTKWNGGHIYDTFEGDFTFDTAWRQPDGWYNALAEAIKAMGLQDYSITLTYVEPGCLLGGTIYNDNGECYEIEMSEDEVMELCGIEEDDEEEY